MSNPSVILLERENDSPKCKIAALKKNFEDFVSMCSVTLNSFNMNIWRTPFFREDHEMASRHFLCHCDSSSTVAITCPEYKDRTFHFFTGCCFESRCKALSWQKIQDYVAPLKLQHIRPRCSIMCSYKCQ